MDISERTRTSDPWLAALLTLALAAAACGGSGEENPPPPVVTVQAATATREPIKLWVQSDALLFPLHQVELTPKINAPVAEFLVNRGSVVTAGEVVARLEDKDLLAAEQEAQSDYEKAQADYQTAISSDIPADLQKAQLDAAAAHQASENAQRVYEARQNLFAQGAISKHDLDDAALDLTNAKNADQLAQQHMQALEQVAHAQAVKAAEAELDSAKAHLAAAQAEVGYSEIHSPISGVVTDRPLYTGEMASTSAPIMTIMDLSQIVAKAHIPADQASRLRVDAEATVTPPDGTPLPARVTVVSAATDPGSTTIEVWAQAANPGDALHPGTSVRAAFLAETVPNAITIPALALLTDAGGATSVMVIGADSKAHEQDVEVGIRNADRVQITKGLNAGQRVVTVGAYALADQTQVKVVTPKP